MLRDHNKHLIITFLIVIVAALKIILLNFHQNVTCFQKVLKYEMENIKK